MNGRLNNTVFKYPEGLKKFTIWNIILQIKIYSLTLTNNMKNL